MSNILAFTHPLVIELIESPSPYVILISILISQSVHIPSPTGGIRIFDVCILIFNFAVLCQVSNCNFAKLGKNRRVI